MIIDNEIKRSEPQYTEPADYPNMKQSVGLGLYFILFSLLVAMPVEIVRGMMHIEAKKYNPLFTLAEYAAGAILTILYGFYRYRRVEQVPYKFKFNKIPAITMVVSVLMIMTMPVLTDPVSVLLPMPDWAKKMFEEMFDNNMYTYISVIILAPVLEETIFRGIILNGLLKTYSPQTAIVVSASIFAFVHLNPWQAIPAFLGGLLMGWMYWKTNSIIPGMILHFVNNLFSTLLGLAFKDADTIKQLMSTPAYVALYFFCVAVMMGGWLFLERYFEKNPTPEAEEWEAEPSLAEEEE